MSISGVTCRACTISQFINQPTAANDRTRHAPAHDAGGIAHTSITIHAGCAPSRWCVWRARAHLRSATALREMAARCSARTPTSHGARALPVAPRPRCASERGTAGRSTSSRQEWLRSRKGEGEVDAAVAEAGSLEGSALQNTFSAPRRTAARRARVTPSVAPRTVTSLGSPQKQGSDFCPVRKNRGPRVLVFDV